MRVRYNFRIEHPINRDATLLILVRYVTPGDDVNESYAELFTEDGWERFEPFALLNIDRVPRIEGADQIEAMRVRHILGEFQERVTSILEAAEAASNG